MAILLPQFSNKYSLSLRVCGELKGEEKIPSLTKEDIEEKVAEYQAVSKKVFLRGWCGGKGKKHLHMECALPELFSPNRTPKPNHKVSDISELAERILGKELDALISGFFNVSLEEIPDGGIIRTLSIEQKAVDISIKLIGGQLKLTGTPVKRIDWFESEKEKGIVRVRLEAVKTITVSDKYLIDSSDWLSEQFLLFVLGRRNNETK